MSNILTIRKRNRAIHKTMTSLAPDPISRPAAPVTLSLVVPMYHEEAVIDVFFTTVEAEMQALGESYEIICVNDGSKDATLAKLLAHRSRNPLIKIIDLSRNFGKEVALSAGLDHAVGAAVIPMDADLQDPPSLIRDFVAKWREGYDVVYGVRASRLNDDPLKRFTAGWFYKLYNALAPLKIPADTGDFRLLDRRVVEVLKALPERNRFMKGLFNWVGFKQTGISYERQGRVAGVSKWGYWRLWNFALDGITSFSTLPLRVWSYVGFAIATIAFGYAMFLIFHTLFTGSDVAGYPSLMVVMLFLGGLQMMGLGVLGEYLGRMFHETKRRPPYIVNHTYGITGGNSSH